MGVRQVVFDDLGCRGARSGVTPPTHAGGASVDIPGSGTSSAVAITQVSGLRAGETFVVELSVIGNGSISLSEPDAFATGRVLADSADLGVSGNPVGAASRVSGRARGRTLGMSVAIRSVLAGGRAVGKSLTVTFKHGGGR